MNTKLIVLGINRSGTKLASLIAAKACNMRYICLEPFRWEGGIDTKLGIGWNEQLAKRSISKSGIIENQRLPIFSNENVKSKWLTNVLTKQGWDLIKFIHIGRCELYHKICPTAAILAVIREPIAHFTSLKGASFPKEEVANQWRKLKQENYIDPLPNAEKFLSNDLADCARSYFILYKYLSTHLPKKSIKIAFENLKSTKDWLNILGKQLNIEIHHNVNIPNIGISTKNPLTSEETKYLYEKLTPVYNEFLS